MATRSTVVVSWRAVNNVKEGQEESVARINVSKSEGEGQGDCDCAGRWMGCRSGDGYGVSSHDDGAGASTTAKAGGGIEGENYCIIISAVRKVGMAGSTALTAFEGAAKEAADHMTATRRG